MQQISTISDISKLGSIMGIWAHPDDETWASAGIMNIAIKNGQRVACVNATKGEEGIQDESRWPRNQLATIRQSELEHALAIIGNGKIDHFWLDYHDGHCSSVNVDEAAKKLRKIITGFCPDTVLTFGPDGLTGHDDHRSVSRWVDSALLDLEKRPDVFHVCEAKERYESYGKDLDETFNIYFNIDSPMMCNMKDLDICIALPKDVYERKIRAFKAQASQMASIFEHPKHETMLKMARHECFRRA